MGRSAVVGELCKLFTESSLTSFFVLPRNSTFLVGATSSGIICAGEKRCKHFFGID